MIPILYQANETNFDSYGIGVLSETTSCIVTEQRNGLFECVFKYPVSGSLYEYLIEENIIKVKVDDTSNEQLFRIYKLSKPLSQMVSVYTQHISYDLANIPIMPFEVENMPAQLLLNRILANAGNFNGYTDYVDSKDFDLELPKSIRSALGGSEQSLLNKFHGEFKWDNYNVRLLTHRGNDNGVIIEYGKNLTGLTLEQDKTSAYRYLLPYATYTDETNKQVVVTLPEEKIEINGADIQRNKTLIVDLSEYFNDELINVDNLRVKANQYILSNQLANGTTTLKVSFEPLCKQKEYSPLLERVNLCDTVRVRYSQLNVDVKLKVIETVYDSLLEKYVSISLGNQKSSMVDSMNNISTITSSVGSLKATVSRIPSLLETSITNATSLITGNSGGYVVLHGGNDNKPYELLILDNPNIQEAVNVWRWNSSGLGFSSNGYNGPYATAITSRGEIVADFIKTGTLDANLINGYSIVGNQIFVGLNASGVRITSDGVDIIKDDITLASYQGDGFQLTDWYLQQSNNTLNFFRRRN